MSLTACPNLAPLRQSTPLGDQSGKGSWPRTNSPNTRQGTRHIRNKRPSKRVWQNLASKRLTITHVLFQAFPQWGMDYFPQISVFSMWVKRRAGKDYTRKSPSIKRYPGARREETGSAWLHRSGPEKQQRRYVSTAWLTSTKSYQRVRHTKLHDNQAMWNAVKSSARTENRL